MERTSLDPNARGHVDLLSTCALGLVAILAATVGVSHLWLVPILVPLTVIGPGYALTVTAFPRDPAASGRAVPDGVAATLQPDGLDRLALAVGLSILSLAGTGVLVGVSPWSFGRVTAVYSLGGVTMIASILGMIRRRQLAPAGRYYPRPFATLAGGRGSAAVSITLALSVLLVLGIFGFTIAAPQPGEGSTELYVLNAEGGGEPVAADYPSSVTTDETIPLEVGVESHELDAEEYTLIVRLEALDGDEVRAQDRLAEEQFTLEPGEEWRTSLELSPTMTGEDLRLSFLLFREDPEFFVNQRAAYRHTHLWIDVAE